MDRKVDSQVYDLLNSCSGTAKNDRKLDFVGIKINFTAHFKCTAAEIEQIVKLVINFTVHFRRAAAEIEEIVKLIENTKRNLEYSFCISINFTIGSIPAALHPKWIVKLNLNFTICSIPAAVHPKMIVKLIFTRENQLYCQFWLYRCKN